MSVQDSGLLTSELRTWRAGRRPAAWTLADAWRLAIELATGTVVHHEPVEPGGSPTLVTAIAVHDEAIARATLDGRIAIAATR